MCETAYGPFLAPGDFSTPDGAITCGRVATEAEVRWGVRGLRAVERVFDFALEHDLIP